MPNVHCLRCGQEAPGILESQLYPGELGEAISKHVCQGCWDAWRKFAVNVINDYKLRPYMPQDRAIVEKHMKQYLNLELQPVGQTPQEIALIGQDKKVSFDAASGAEKGGTSVTKEKVIEMLKQIYDPEIPVNIHDLGLIYGIDIQGERVTIRMTLTSAHCPAAQSLPANVKEAVSRISGVKETSVDVVWDPPWTKEMISEEGRRVLGL